MFLGMSNSAPAHCWCGIRPAVCPNRSASWPRRPGCSPSSRHRRTLSVPAIRSALLSTRAATRFPAAVSSTRLPRASAMGSRSPSPASVRGRRYAAMASCRSSKAATTATPKRGTVATRIASPSRRAPLVASSVRRVTAAEAAWRARCRRRLVEYPARSVLSIKDRAEDRRDAFVWKWAQGAETLPGDFGDPTASDDYQLCVFDGGADPATLLFGAAVPAAGTCGSEPCWKALGQPAGSRGYRYENRFDQTPDGIRKLQLRPGAGGRAKVTARGKGPLLMMPGEGGHAPLPVTEPVAVRVELRAADGECWAATYADADTRANDGEGERAYALRTRESSVVIAACEPRATSSGRSDLRERSGASACGAVGGRARDGTGGRSGAPRRRARARPVCAVCHAMADPPPTRGWGSCVRRRRDEPRPRGDRDRTTGRGRREQISRSAAPRARARNAATRDEKNTKPIELTSPCARTWSRRMPSTPSETLPGDFGDPTASDDY